MRIPLPARITRRHRRRRLQDDIQPRIWRPVRRPPSAPVRDDRDHETTPAREMTESLARRESRKKRRRLRGGRWRGPRLTFVYVD